MTVDQFGVAMDRFDSDDRPCTLDSLTSKEPAWAANVIRSLEAEVARLRTGLNTKYWDTIRTENDTLRTEVAQLRSERDEHVAVRESVSIGLGLANDEIARLNAKGEHLAVRTGNLLLVAKDVRDWLRGSGHSGSEHEQVLTTAIEAFGSG